LQNGIPDEELLVTRTQLHLELNRTNMLNRILIPIKSISNIRFIYLFLYLFKENIFLDALQKGNLKKGDLTAVLLAGGGCRMPIITTWLQDFFANIVCPSISVVCPLIFFFAANFESKKC
jgi:molecular chaperone DnaK (HSP70)